ncbi:GmrSD restriction endonuclease domain-containing protein [Nocardioides mangrovi]|uniref:DUF262 domain-containing protein n=1 Tax=Nocardioides mangrovi TaxID=2874580 RepID=A0ABS7UK31_9ACTN|nr:DUF262 domain-containing protein [Nocardioides mangrovi]MBZ5741137.1 DUF262 domain-containing protein [Nocardioides mangrovi]
MTELQAQLDKHRQKVDVDHFDIPVRELLRMLEDQELAIAPEYQRQFRWDAKRESELIESLLLGLPVPPLFVATNPDATWELVDGLQRVSTMIHFAGSGEQIQEHIAEDAEPLELTDLKKLTAFNGLTFDDLPTSLQVTLLRRALRVTALSDKSQLEVRFDLFERLNRGGVVLTPQEVRACIYRGPFNAYIGEAAHSEPFKTLLKLQKGSEADGTREEQVLKFFAYLYARDRFDGRVTEFLNTFMEENRAGKDLKKWRKLFDDTVDALWGIFKGPALKGNYPLTPLNQFEALMVATAELLEEKKKPRGTPARVMNDPDLLKHSTKGTNTTAALRGRIQRAKELLS